ncbi:MAG: hypothetical protein ACTSP0_04875 [Alphaproteobacteria bacterium]
MSMRKKSAGGSAIPERERGIDEVSQAALSKRIWVILTVLAGLLIYTGIGMITAQGQLDGVTSALQRAETRAKETGLKLIDALADKEQALADKQEILREISAQGQRIAESTQGEEKARAALAAVSSGAETAEKNIAARDREIADLKARLARSRTALRKADGARSKLMAEVAALKAELRFARTTQENTLAELERLRAAAEPYSPTANPAGRLPQ